MPSLRLGNIWNILREVDFRQIHDDAEHPVDIAVAGLPGGAGGRLADVLRHGEAPATGEPASAIRTVGPNVEEHALGSADLLIAVDLDPQALIAVRDIVPVIRVDTSATPRATPHEIARVDLPAVDREHVEDVLAPPIVEQFEDDALAAARRLPVLRRAYGDWLIDETSRTNALYAFSTGIAETVPVLNVPLNVADLVILTKNQIIMVYKLALAAGRPMSPRTVVGEMLGVIGAGFMWRQIARELVGLIPVAGIIPKVAVAYGGTYAVGEAIQAYLIRGEVPAKDQLEALYTEALERGRTLAESLAKRTTSRDNRQLTDESEIRTNA